MEAYPRRQWHSPSTTTSHHNTTNLSSKNSVSSSSLDVSPKYSSTDSSSRRYSAFTSTHPSCSSTTSGGLNSSRAELSNTNNSSSLYKAYNNRPYTSVSSGSMGSNSVSSTNPFVGGELSTVGEDGFEDLNNRFRSSKSSSLSRESPNDAATAFSSNSWVSPSSVVKSPDSSHTTGGKSSSIKKSSVLREEVKNYKRSISSSTTGGLTSSSQLKYGGIGAASSSSPRHNTNPILGGDKISASSSMQNSSSLHEANDLLSKTSDFMVNVDGDFESPRPNLKIPDHAESDKSNSACSSAGIGGGSLTSPNLVCSKFGSGTLSPTTTTTTTPSSQMENPLFSVKQSPSRLSSSHFSSLSSSSESRKTSSSVSTLRGDGFNSKPNVSSMETSTANKVESVHVQEGDQSFSAKSETLKSRARMESGGVVAEKAKDRQADSVRHVDADGDVRESNKVDLTEGARLKNGDINIGNVKKSVFSSDSHKSAATGKTKFRKSLNVLNVQNIADMISCTMSREELTRGLDSFDDLKTLNANTDLKNVESALIKYCGIMSNTLNVLKKEFEGGEVKMDENEACTWMVKINDLMARAWHVPSFGREIGTNLCDVIRNNGGLDLLIDNCHVKHEQLQFNSAKLLQQCMITENRGYVVENGLEKVVNVAKDYTKDITDVEKSRVGTGILQNLFKHSESTCGEVIEMGGLDDVVNECKSTDVETLRHCAGALANVAMYGGSENQEAMIKRKVPSWLFPLAFHNDDTIKYFACMAIALLVANKEIEASVKQSGTLDLINPFVQSHSPKTFAKTVSSHYGYGQSANWLRRLVPILDSHREEAKNLAAFHFCLEAEMWLRESKATTSDTDPFSELKDLYDEIGVVKALKRLASTPNGIATKYAVRTLRVIGLDVPHKLSQKIPNWSCQDVEQWIKQVGFAQFSNSFVESQVDGDLLLQLTDEMLKEDLKMENGILRRRFMREICDLKRLADYSSCDTTNLNSFLFSIGPDYCIYTYSFISHGIDLETLIDCFDDDSTIVECGVLNKIHRRKIQQRIRVERGETSSVTSISTNSSKKKLDVFISYRRSNGSQLASLLKVHLELRNFSVFLDVDRLEAGKFDNNLLQSIRHASNFILVLTPNALDRCINDVDQSDWIHKEIACAIQSSCNIIPIFDNFVLPNPTDLPETMRPVISYNGVKWIHDYQEACVDKIDRFIRGDSGSVTGASQFTNNTNSFVMDRFFSSQHSSSLAAPLKSAPVQQFTSTNSGEIIMSMNNGLSNVIGCSDAAHIGREEGGSSLTSDEPYSGDGRDVVEKSDIVGADL